MADNVTRVGYGRRWRTAGRDSCASPPSGCKYPPGQRHPLGNQNMAPYPVVSGERRGKTGSPGRLQAPSSEQTARRPETTRLLKMVAAIRA
ncbi:hypothetical protein NDU88_005900 [Pleurodeles waltl]|uniref:Uncharacterized protein n=1 Tax=Pleurodeles waltl TaxID=8319 RepID=A0AAV7VKC7_PLEWA|nr:hypothetical protein NDU88_005900 [Pleurodeles waltl]